MRSERFDIHQHITDQIVTAIEQGPGEFRLPWHRSAGSIMRPVNIASKKAYRGVNILALWAAADAAGYTSGRWGTYRQWAEQRQQVRKGEKASYIVFYKEIDVPTETDGEEAETRLFARATPVFAAEQIEGYATLPDEAPAPEFPPLEATERFVAGSGARVISGGSRAFYRPSTDTIHLPARSDFVGSLTSTPAETYYSTLLHELTHWTGTEARCHRDFGKRFGDAAYAVEELVAELGAAFLCAELGIAAEPRPDHAQYLTHWLAVMKADKKAIFTAASKASQAATFLAALQSPPPA